MAAEDKKLFLGDDSRVFGKAVSPDPATRTPVAPRFLRRARRHAEKLGLTPADDYEAIALLLDRGIDIMAGEAPPVTDVQLALPATGKAISTEVRSPGNFDRQREIARIEKGLIRRRRRRLGLLMIKLLFFVVLPTALVGWYYASIATPLYETHSEFVIQKADSAGSGLPGLLSGTPMASAQDSLIVQGFLTSREAMLRLDAEEGFRTHFSDPAIDSLRRLPVDASDETAFKVYNDVITVGFDPTEGIIRMSVTAASAETSQKFANALVRYAEERVDTISQRVREDHMRGAQESYDKAEAAMFAAQQEVLQLQQQRGVLSSEVEVSSQMAIITSLEADLETKRLELSEIMSNPKPNQTRAELTNAEIARLDDRINELRALMTDNSNSTTSLAMIAGELRVAETNFTTRQLLLQQSLAQMETARIEANRQVRYLAMGVTPVAPDVATLPRRIENTALSFVIFIGIYLLASLTVSILREQVSV